MQHFLFAILFSFYFFLFCFNWLIFIILFEPHWHISTNMLSLNTSNLHLINESLHHPGAIRGRLEVGNIILNDFNWLESLILGHHMITSNRLCVCVCKCILPNSVNDSSDSWSYWKQYVLFQKAIFFLLVLH